MAYATGNVFKFLADFRPTIRDEGVILQIIIGAMSMATDEFGGTGILVNLAIDEFMGPGLAFNFRSAVLSSPEHMEIFGNQVAGKRLSDELFMTAVFTPEELERVMAECLTPEQKLEAIVQKFRDHGFGGQVEILVIDESKQEGDPPSAD